MNNLTKISKTLGAELLLGSLAVIFLLAFAGVKTGTFGHKEAKLQKVSLTQMVGDVFKEEKFEVFTIQDQLLGQLYREAAISPDYYIRKYTSKICYGFDAKEMSENDIRFENDTLFVKIPKIKLLDEQFLNESAQHTLFEKPTNWDTKHQSLVVSLRNLVQAQAIRKSEIKGYYENAVEAAKTEMTTIFQSFGYENVTIEIADTDNVIRYDYRKYPEAKRYLDTVLPVQPFLEERYFAFDNGNRLYYGNDMDYGLILPLVDYVYYNYRNGPKTSVYAQMDGNRISIGEVINEHIKKDQVDEIKARINAAFVKEEIYPEYDVVPVIWEKTKSQDGSKYAFRERSISELKSQAPNINNDEIKQEGDVQNTMSNFKSSVQEKSEKAVNKLKSLTQKNK